jgi:hypothetical protein
MTRHTLLLMLGVLCPAVVSGCGDGLAEVSGTVLIDGRPLPEGEIIFEEADRSKTPAASKIVDGKYTVRVLPGAKVVRVNASRPTRIPDPVLGAAAREPMIAPEFNEKSRLTVEVKPGNNSRVDFAVVGLP